MGETDVRIHRERRKQGKRNMTNPGHNPTGEMIQIKPKGLKKTQSSKEPVK